MNEIDVVIVAYGNGEAVAECVQRAQSLASVREVVLVDHGDDEAARAAACSGARVPSIGRIRRIRRRPEPRHRAGATQAPFVLMLNPDAEIDTAGIEAGLELLASRPDVAGVQGVIVNRGTGTPERSQGRELGPLHLLGRAFGARRLLQVAPVRAIAGRRTVRRSRGSCAGRTGRTARVDHAARYRATRAPHRVESVGGFDVRTSSTARISTCAAGSSSPVGSSSRCRSASPSTTTACHPGGARPGSSRRGAARCVSGPLVVDSRVVRGGSAAWIEWAKLSLQAPRHHEVAWRELVAGPISDRRALR